MIFDLRRRAFGKPDGWFIRLRCWLLGHDELPCEPECCNSVWCERCLARLRELPSASASAPDGASQKPASPSPGAYEDEQKKDLGDGQKPVVSGGGIDV